MKRFTLRSMTLIGSIGILSAYALVNPTTPAPSTAEARVRVEPALVAGPGRVEPISEQVAVAARLADVITSIRVTEGERLHPGQIIATLDDTEYQAQVSAAAARLRRGQSEFQRLINGPRVPERRASEAAVSEARAVLKNTEITLERQRMLFGDGLIAREQVERAEREYQVAKAQMEAVVEQHSLLVGEPREEDRIAAESTVVLAQAQLDEERARLAKTVIRAPVAGIVLRVHQRPGEIARTELPIVTLADDSKLRVRMEVDETDIGLIRPGQAAYVTAPAYPQRRFRGVVGRISNVLGRKAIRTDAPGERLDMEVLETLIELDDGERLPLGLRVDAFIVLRPSL
jgi:HlyD family secretion protein